MGASTSMKGTFLTLSLVAGALIGWIDTNLGELFWLVLGLTVLDILIGVGKDVALNASVTITPGKMLKGLAAVGIPVFVRTFAVDATGANIHYALQTAFAAIIVVQLTAIMPEAYTFIKYAAKSLSNGNKAVEMDLTNISDHELGVLIAKLEARLSQNGASAADKQVVSTIKTFVDAVGKSSANPTGESKSSLSSLSQSSSEPSATAMRVASGTSVKGETS